MTSIFYRPSVVLQHNERGENTMFKRNFKVGQKVKLSNNWSTELVTISKVTPKGMYRIEETPSYLFGPDGFLRGQGSYNRSRLSAITQADIDSLRKKAKAKKISMVDLITYSEEELDAILAILKVDHE